MKGFDKKYKDLPDYILKITEQIWENKDVESIGKFYTKDIPVRLSLIHISEPTRR